MRLILFLTGIILIAIGCKSSKPAQANDAAVAAPPIADIDWTVAAIDGEEIEGKRRPTMVLSEGMATGDGGCNRYRASYKLSGQELSFGPAAATKRACPDLKMEDRFQAALTKVVGFKKEADEMLLIDDSGTSVLTLVASAPKS